MGKRKGPNRENLEQTRRVFLEIAREEFVKTGYNDASTNAIVNASGMARGSLYYHFGDKFGLFNAIYSELVDECYARVKVEMNKYQDQPDMAIFAGCDIFLDFCMKTDFRRIVLIEAQTALSYKQRLQKVEETILVHLREVLNVLEQQKRLKGCSVNTIVIFIAGILAEVGRSFDNVSDLMKHKEECTKTLRITLKAMIN